MPSFSTRPLFDDYYLSVGLLGAVLVGLLLLGPARSRTTRGRRGALSAIRLATIALVIFALLRPAVVYTQTQQQTAALVVLADRSRSMGVPDAFGGKTRWEALRESIAQATPALADLADELDVQVYVFDSESHKLDFTAGKLELDDVPTGEATAIGANLDDLLRRQAGQRVAGVILLSDGAQRALPPRDAPPQAPARQFKDLGYRLYTVVFGQAGGVGQVADVALKDFLVDPAVFVKNQLVVSGTARVDGYTNQQVVMRLLWEAAPGRMEVVDSVPISATQEGQLVKFELSYVPETPGEHRLAVQAVPQTGETVTTNNESATYVTVLKGGLDVLYLEGALRPEAPRLRRALGQSQDVQVDFLRMIAQEPATRPDDLAKRFSPGEYDVYILGDLDSTAFTKEELEQLAATVDGGAGFIALGGVHSFGPGAYFSTPLADVLPVEMSKLDRQRPDEPVRGDMHLPGPLRMVPTSAGQRHFVMLLDAPQANAAAWGKLAPLDGANELKTKPAATVLAETEAGEPLLVAGNYGNGRVLAFGGDSTWRWCLAGQAEAHRRFWRQLVLWLAKKEQSTDEAVWARLGERRYMPGARVEFSAGARSEQGLPVEDAQLEAEVTLPDGTRKPVRLARQPGQFGGSFAETSTPGEYTLTVRATQAGVPLGQSETRFLVYAQDLELDNPAADQTTLASLAAITGGRSLTPEQLPALLEELREYPETLEVKVETRRDLYDNALILAAFVALLGTEWFLRKRWGLV